MGGVRVLAVMLAVALCAGGAVAQTETEEASSTEGAPQPEPTAEAQSARPVRPTVDDAAGWALLVAGLGSAYVGGVLWVVGAVDAATVTNAVGGTSWSDVRGAHERAPILGGVGVAAILAGAGLTIVGVVVIATARAAGAPSVAVRAGPGGLWLEGRF